MKILEVVLMVFLVPLVSSEECAPCKKVVGKTGEEPYIGDYDLLPGSNPACQNGCAYQLEGTDRKFCFENKVSDYTTVNMSCYEPEENVTRTELVIRENGEILVQENYYNNETGALEVRVPAHGNYTDTTVIMDTKSGTELISTNQTCQVSDLPSSYNVSEQAGQMGNTKKRQQNTAKVFVLKSRVERVGHEGRKNIASAFQSQCSDQSVVKTEDRYVSSEEDFQKFKNGGVIIVNTTGVESRFCSKKEACSFWDETSCLYGYKWINPFTEQLPPNEQESFKFSLHRVTAGSICVNCTKKFPGPGDCDSTDFSEYCLCEDITSIDKLVDCRLCGTSDSDCPPINTQFDPQEGGRKRFSRQIQDTVTQTLTYSGDQYPRQAVSIYVPAHGDYQELTLIMSSDSSGYWTFAKNNLMRKIGNTCYVSTPGYTYPIDIAIGLQEIKITITPEDEVSTNSFLLDRGPLSVSDEDDLHPLVKEACSNSTITKSINYALTKEESQLYSNGNVVFVDPYRPADGNCDAQFVMMNNNTNDASGPVSWLKPNAYGPKIIVREVIAVAANIKCCNKVGDPCCEDHCLCSDIVTAQDVETCSNKGDISEGDFILVASGTLDSEKPDNTVQLLGRQDDGSYLNIEIKSSCSALPTKSSFSIGAVADSEYAQTVVICEGYTENPPSNCYKLDGSAWVVYDSGLPSNLLTNGGASVVFQGEFDGQPDIDIWWIVGTDGTGTNTVELSIPYRNGTYSPTSGPQLPIEMNTPCIAKVNSSHAFVTGQSVQSSISNKAWLYEFVTRIWTPLPDTLAQRFGEACGVLEGPNGAVAVIAGGYELSSSEYLDLTDPGTGWNNGPSIGEARYGAKMVSMMEAKELVLIGGLDSSNKATPIVRVLNENMISWENKGVIDPAVYSAVAKRAPKKILESCL